MRAWPLADVVARNLAPWHIAKPALWATLLALARSFVFHEMARAGVFIWQAIDAQAWLRADSLPDDHGLKKRRWRRGWL
jgi:hypothetical protein